MDRHTLVCEYEADGWGSYYTRQWSGSIREAAYEERDFEFLMYDIRAERKIGVWCVLSQPKTLKVNIVRL